MQCKNCGYDLPKESKFCLNCGEKVDYSTLIENTSSSDEDKQLEEAITFNIAGNKITFNSTIVEYNKLRKQFHSFAGGKRQEFKTYYNDNVRSFDNLFEIGIPKFAELISSSITFSIEKLMEYGVDHIDSDTLLNMAGDSMDFYPILEPYFEFSENIQELANQLGEHRAIQRSNRSQWYGGGFGVRGAIKGAMTAGALNMATGAFRGIGDSLTNASDRAKITKMKNSIIEDQRTFDTLLKGIRHYCFMPFHTVAQILKNENLFPDVSFSSSKQNAILQNYLTMLKLKKTTDDKIINILYKCIQTYPYDLKYYTNLYQFIKEDKKSILSVVEYFGLDKDYTEHIVKYDTTRLEKIKKLPEDSVEDIENKIKLLNDLNTDNPAIETNSIVDNLKEKIVALNQTASIKQIREPIDNAISNNNFDYVWTEIKKGNVYAEYVLENYYTKLCDYCFSTSCVDSIIADVINQAKYNNNIFAKYLIERLYYRVYEKTDKNKELNTTYNLILDIANNGNISANAFIGTLGCYEYYRTKNNNMVSMSCLELAANSRHPNASARLGDYYRTGERELPKDTNKARKYITLAAEYGDTLGIRNLNELNGKAPESCFITTAVCKSLGKPDNCFELNALRNFRDNWLKKQPDGESLVKEYYSIAPTIVDNINLQESSKNIYFHIWSNYIIKCLELIKTHDYSGCKKQYISMVSELKSLYYNN